MEIKGYTTRQVTIDDYEVTFTVEGERGILGRLLDDPSSAMMVFYRLKASSVIRFPRYFVC